MPLGAAHNLVMAAHPALIHELDIRKRDLASLVFYGQLFQLPAHRRDALRVYLLNNAAGIGQRIADLKEPEHGGQLAYPCFSLIDRDTYRGRLFRYIPEQGFQEFLVLVDDIAVVHIPRIIFAAPDDLYIIVDPVRVVNPGVL